MNSQCIHCITIRGHETKTVNGLQLEMTAVFFFKDESSMKARQTVFFAHKSPEASSS